MSDDSRDNGDDTEKNPPVVVPEINKHPSYRKMVSAIATQEELAEAHRVAEMQAALAALALVTEARVSGIVPPELKHALSTVQTALGIVHKASEHLLDDEEDRSIVDGAYEIITRAIGAILGL